MKKIVALFLSVLTLYSMPFNLYASANTRVSTFTAAHEYYSATVRVKEYSNGTQYLAPTDNSEKR